MTAWPGCAFTHFSNSAAGALSSSEQPASRSGTTTVLPGFRILAVSAMKWTPANAITAASVFAAACASCSESPTWWATSWMSASW
jgi:hypothetical protein